MYLKIADYKTNKIFFQDAKVSGERSTTYRGYLITYGNNRRPTGYPSYQVWELARIKVTNEYTINPVESYHSMATAKVYIDDMDPLTTEILEPENMNDDSKYLYDYLVKNQEISIAYWLFRDYGENEAEAYLNVMLRYQHIPREKQRIEGLEPQQGILVDELMNFVKAYRK